MQNAVDLTSIVKKIKEATEKNIWLWSGYSYEEILKNKNRKALLEEIDVLVDGKFIEDKKDLTLKFRGSSNQRIIDVKKSLEKNTIVNYQL